MSNLTHLMAKNWIFLLAIFLCVVFGYGYFTPDILLLEDDISGRYKAIKNLTSIDGQAKHFNEWTMGRPLGHVSNVTFQQTFLGLPENFIVFFGILAIAAQSLFLKLILKIVGFSNKDSIILALIFFLTPVSASLFLPVHAFATELSTWFILLSIYFLLSKKPVLAGLFASLQFMTYEAYATIFWLPIAFLMLQYALRSEKWDVTRKDLISISKIALKFFIFFLVGVTLLFLIRYYGPGNGRASGISELGIGGILSRMMQAGWIGIKTNLSLHFESLEWAMKNGPKYILMMFIILTGLSYFIVKKTETHFGSNIKSYSFATIAIVAILGFVLLFFSYLIFFEQRFPPRIKVGRVANIHSGSRFGILFLAAAILMLCDRPKASQYIRTTVIAVSISIGMVFQHAYGYQEAKSSRKKSSIIEALNLGCQNTSENDIIVVLTPQTMDWYRTDIILAWTAPLIAPTSFKGWKNKVAVVSYAQGAAFEEAYKEKGINFTKKDLMPFTHRSFKGFKFLYPWGDMARWPENDGVIRPVKIVDMGKNVYVPKLIFESGTEKLENKTCIRR